MIFFHAIQLYPMRFLSWVKVYCDTFSGSFSNGAGCLSNFSKVKTRLFGVNECTHLQRSKFSVQGLLGQPGNIPQSHPPEKLCVRFAGFATRNPFMTGPTVSLILFQGNELGLNEGWGASEKVSS